MKVFFDTPVSDFHKELADILNLFFGSVQVVTELLASVDLKVVMTETTREQDRECLLALSGRYQMALYAKGLVGEDALTDKRLHKRLHKTVLFDALVLATGKRLPWGSLTGIRPTRLVYEVMDWGLELEAALLEVSDTFRLSEEKTTLLRDIIKVQKEIKQAADHEVSCYIGIPFCRTRCRYCSFLSSEVGDGKLLPDYTDALIKEIKGTAALMKKRNLHARSLYIGGGTPTTLSAEQLKAVMLAASPLIEKASEVTVEAGRPDTITREKLEVIRDLGATRISINPQTMFDRTLKMIGRDHTVEQILEAFHLARELGFSHINMDLIAGLPGETPEMFEQTITQVLALDPEALTVHTLAVKRSSDMHRYLDPLPDATAVEKMVNFARSRAALHGLQPYYLYRQKHIAGNLENVGYAKPGFACLYNVDMMEDRTTVLAMGAGAVSKLVDPNNRRILRSPNVKDVGHYLARVDEMLKKKDALFEGVGKGVRPPEVEID